MPQNPIDKIDNIERPVIHQNFSSSTQRILDIFRNSNLEVDDFRISVPSQIQVADSLVVSIYLFNIFENPFVRAHSTSVFSKPDDEHSYSENILQYLITVHSNDHLEAINSMEKLLGILYSTPSIHVAHDVKQLHLKIDLKENPIEIWDKLFPSTPYRLSFLLTVHGAGVTYTTPKIKTHHSITKYDSTEEPEEIFNM